MDGDRGIPMPARERFYPGTVWTVRNLPDVPEHLRGKRVELFTELLSEDADAQGGIGLLYTYAFPENGSPADTLWRIDDIFWLE